MTCWQSKARFALRLLLGAVFLYAAWSKLREPWALFAIAVDGYGILPHWAVVAVARALPWAELLLGLLLLTGRLPRASAAAVSAILLFFFAIVAGAYRKGMAIDCGCFGFGEALSARTLARDGALLACSLALTAMVFSSARESRAHR